MANNKFIKDPDSVLDYAVNWLTWLDGDTISASSWTIPTGLTEDSDTFGDSTATVWLSGGTVGIRGNLDVDGTVINFINMPSDSTGLATGDLWFNSTTGAIHRKF